MEKTKVYIDFEAIPSPFNFYFEKFVEVDIPFAYTLGIYVEKKFITKTKVVNFTKVKAKDTYSFVKKAITKDVREVLLKKNFVINNKTVEFVG